VFNSCIHPFYLRLIEELVHEKLNENHMEFNRYWNFGEYQSDHFVRLSFPSAESELEEGLKRLSGFMKKQHI